MSDGGVRVPPLFWINDAGSGPPMSVAVSGRRAICFFSTEALALQCADRRLGRGPGVRWYPVGSDRPEDLLWIAEGAPREGSEDGFWTRLRAEASISVVSGPGHSCATR